MLQRWHNLEDYATKMAQSGRLCYKDGNLRYYTILWFEQFLFPHPTFSKGICIKKLVHKVLVDELETSLSHLLHADYHSEGLHERLEITEGEEQFRVNSVLPCFGGKPDAVILW